jgi:hypothetical protein
VTLHRGGRLSRREVIAGTLVAGGSALLGDAAAAGAAEAGGDAKALTAALKFERLSVLAYEHIRTLPVVSAHVALLTELLDQEREHVRVLEAELKALGRPLPRVPRRLSQVNDALSDHGLSGDLTNVTTLKDAVKLLVNVAALCEGAYYTAAGNLTATGPLVRAAQALASEGQHATLLSGLIDKGQIKQSVPAWYVAGVK